MVGLFSRPTFTGDDVLFEGCEKREKKAEMKPRRRVLTP